MLPSAVDSLELRDTHCVRPHRFINRLPVSSHVYTWRAGERDRRGGREEKNSFVLRLSGNKRRMGAVTSESDRMKEGQQRERHSVMEKWRKTQVRLKV